VQDAFLKVQPRFAQLDAPAAYLRAAVVNRCRNHLRRLSLERARATGAPLLVEDPAVDETWQQLRRLTPRKRAAIVLRFYEDLPDARIAELLDCREATVRSAIHRGLAKLREEIER
jgi:RNA polymerase sigma factor (sigma-70 family)